MNIIIFIQVFDPKDFTHNDYYFEPIKYPLYSIFTKYCNEIHYFFLFLVFIDIHYGGYQ